MKKVLIWEIIGAAFIVIAGILLHPAYHNSGRLAILAPFSPVNESVWEHMKIGVWPATLFAIIEYFLVGKGTHNFIKAKGAAVYLIPMTIIAVFNNYICLLGQNMFSLDILTFIIAASFGQLVSYFYLTNPESDQIWDLFYGLLWIGLLVAVIWVTYLPPHLPVFMDPITKLYGIPY